MQVVTGDGVVLDAVLGMPTGEPSGLVVLCHPHPLRGGSMHVPLLLALDDALRRGGLAVVRFDFRGTGRSGSQHSGGQAEVDDVAAAVAAARAELPGLDVTVGGWSFGAAVAWRWLVEHDEDVLWAGLAPALDYAGGEARPATHGRPGLLVVGDADIVLDAEDARRWADTQPVDVRVDVLTGGTHFFAGTHAIDAIERVADFLLAAQV